MRALGNINTVIQKPFTTFGMPSRLTIMVFVLVAVFYTFAAMSGFSATAFLGAVFILAIVCPLLWNRNRQERHLETLILHSKTRWKGQKQLKLLAGTPVKRRKAA